jgi:hypothetical protein
VGMEGMDVESGQLTARHIASKGDVLADLSASLTSELHQVQWVGPDRDVFVDQFTVDIAATVHAAVTEIARIAHELNDRIIRQQAVSNE